MAKKKAEPPPPLRIRHEFLEPRPDDQKRFLEIVRMLRKLGAKDRE